MAMTIISTTYATVRKNMILALTFRATGVPVGHIFPMPALRTHTVRFVQDLGSTNTVAARLMLDP
eukprot:522367-Pyramimonas_sp.AAC.1